MKRTPEELARIESIKATINENFGYDLTKVAANIEAFIPFNWDAALKTCAEFKSMRFRQVTVERLLLLHADEAIKMFTADNYSFKGRILMALHFLGVINMLEMARNGK